MKSHASLLLAVRRGTALALLAVAGLAPAVASTLDEPESLIQGADAVVRLHFDVRVQYQRHAPTGSADLVEIFFQLPGGDQPAAPVEESVSTSEQGKIPAVTVTYPVQPGAQVRKVVVRFSRKMAFKVRAGPTSQSIDIVFPGAMTAAAAPPAVVEHDRFAITLQVVPLDQQDQLRSVPGRFQDYTVFSTHGWQGGRPAVELDLGYFDSQEAAEKVAKSALREFPDAKVFDVVKRKEEMLAKVAEAAAAPPPPAPPAEAPPAPAPPAPLPVVPAPPLPVVPPAPVLPAAVPEVSAPQTAAPSAGPQTPDTDLDRQAKELLDKARAALASGNNEAAIAALNQLLLLPPNKYSQDAQELIGVARERAGDIEQARKEYELYLKLFPNGEGATRVRQRLASLAPPPQAAAAAAASPKEKGSKYGASGSLSQYYYGGKTQVNTTFLPGGVNTANQQSLTSTSLSSLVSTLDLTGRYRDGSNDARLVLRDSNSKSFGAADSSSTNRLDSAYVDYRNTSYGFSAKLGRQSGVTGGLVGRFDGAVLGYDLSPKWRVTAVGGVPTDVVVGASQSFEGASIEAQNLWEHWGGDGFFINQMTDGATDRRALGGDVRYFDSVRTLYTMVDYDINFMSLNAVTVQGTWQLPDQTSFSLLADDRKAPELLTSNALLNPNLNKDANGNPIFLDSNGNPIQFTSIRQLANFYTQSRIREFAKDITANAKQFSLSISRPFGASWQASTDVRLSNVGALPAIVVPNCVAPVSCVSTKQEGTGNVWTYDLQVTGTNLYSKRDLNSFSFSHLTGPAFKGNQVGYTNLTGFWGNRVTVEPSLRYYTEDSADGNRLTRLSPALRATYKLLQHLSLESQILYERSKTDGPAQQDTTSNAFYYLGYRYDLQ
jgi:tetratricopeptide (TPR) repeat protein